MTPWCHLVMGYTGPMLLVSAILLQVLAAAHARWRWLLPPILAVLMSLPLFGGLSAAEYIRGWVGDLSVTTILLLGISTWRGISARQVLQHKDRAAIFACTTLAGLFLYPLTLGAGTWDPYQLGYRPLAMLAALALLAVVGRLRRLPRRRLHPDHHPGVVGGPAGIDEPVGLPARPAGGHLRGGLACGSAGRAGSRQEASGSRSRCLSRNGNEQSDQNSSQSIAGQKVAPLTIQRNFLRFY